MRRVLMTLGAATALWCLPAAALAQWSVPLIALGGTLAWLLAQLAARRRA